MKAYSERTTTLASPNEKLKRGIWPQSLPLWMAAFYMSLFIIRPWEEMFPSLAVIHIMKIYAICTIAVVLFSNKKRFQMNFQTLAIILFAIAIGISTLFAWKIELSWPDFYDYMTIIIFYFILIMVIRTPYDLVFMVACYIVTMTVYLTKAQMEFFLFGQHRFDPGAGIYRMVGIESSFGGPNSLAMSIVVSLPMLLFLWSMRKEFTFDWPNSWRRWFPRLLVLYSVLAVSSIILTNSRSGMLSFVFFVILISLFRGKGIERKLSYIILGVVVLSMLWVVLPDEKRNRFRSIWDPSAGTEVAQQDAEGRIEGLKAGIETFRRFPLTGVGIGNISIYRLREVDGVRLETHNLFGQLLGETGIIGGVTFSLFIMNILVNCHRVRVLRKRNSNDPKIMSLSNLGLACRDATILLAFEGLFGHNLYRFNWLWLAAFSSLALQFGKVILKQEIKINDYGKAVL